MQDHVEVSIVGLDLRVLHRRHRVFDRQRMEPERVGQDQRFRDRGGREIDPHVHAAALLQPGAIDARRALGDAVAVNEDRDQPSPPL